MQIQLISNSSLSKACGLQVVAQVMKLSQIAADAHLPFSKIQLV